MNKSYYDVISEATDNYKNGLCTYTELLMRLVDIGETAENGLRNHVKDHKEILGTLSWDCTEGKQVFTDRLSLITTQKVNAAVFEAYISGNIRFLKGV